MGAGDTEAADYYMRKLLRITVLASIVWNGLILLITPLVLRGYALSGRGGTSGRDPRCYTQHF